MTMHLAKIITSVVGALVLVTAGATSALSSQPGPFHINARPAANQTVNGNLQINGLLHVNRNSTTYGNSYTHGKAEIYRGLVIRSNGLKVSGGGVKTDSLVASGGITASTASISTSLIAPTMSGTSLTLSGAGASLRVDGKGSFNGVDAGAGGLTTAGNISTSGTIGGGSLLTSGSVSSGSLTTGAATVSSLSSAGLVTAGGLRVTGTADFSGATVSGLNFSTVGLSTLTLQRLSVGSTASTTAPLTVSENNQTASIGVASGGALSLGNVLASTLATSGNATIGGTLTVSAPGGVTASSLTAPTAGGALTLTGSTILLKGAVIVQGTTTLASGNDLVLSAVGGGASARASHITARNDTDVADTVTVNVPSATTANTPVVGATVPFLEAYATQPVVVLTAADNPEPASPSPKVWVMLISLTSGGTTTYTGFKIMYAPSQTLVGSLHIPFNYQVIGT